jgi:hypothetical protein
MSASMSCAYRAPVVIRSAFKRPHAPVLAGRHDDHGGMATAIITSSRVKLFDSNADFGLRIVRQRDEASIRNPQSEIRNGFIVLQFAFSSSYLR